MSTRRIESGDTFDHGAQYFTARDKRFFRYVTSWEQQGIVAKWPDRGLGSEQKLVAFENGLIKSESNSEDRFVAVPSMNSICKHLAAGLQVRTQTQIANVTRMGDEIELFDESQACLGKFHRLIVSAPAAQAAQLLADLPEVAGQISKIQMNPC